MSNSTDRVLGGSNQYNAVFTDKKDNSKLEQADFIKLMVAQMQNQDFTDPMDNSQMVNQMVQFSNMQQMQEMAEYSKTSYAMSLVGKMVTASRYTLAGGLDTTTGVVQKMSLVDNEYVVYVGGKKYTLAQIMSVQSAGGASGSLIDPTGYALKAQDVKADSAALEWAVPTEDEMTAAKLKYSVYYSDTDMAFDTVEKVEAGTQGSAGQLGTSAVINGLAPGQEYLANVVVTDESGAKSVYKPVKFKTVRS